MAVSDSAKVDLLYKKAFGVTKTDLPANKSPSNESIASPALNRADSIWQQASEIPATAAAVANVVSAYQGTNKVQCTADTTSVPISSVYPSWKTNLTDWIPSEFGSTYFIKVYVDNSGASDPSSTGTQIFDSGSGNTGEWNFDYQAGVLNFIGGTIPAVLTSSKVVYVMGYRYIGRKGLNTFANLVVGNLSIAGNTITSSSGNISLGNLKVQNTTISSLTGNIYLSPLATTDKVVLTNSSSITLPVGNDSDRPNNPTVGDFRYNSSTASIEYWNGSGWIGTSVNLDSQIIYADGTSDTFTLNNASTTKGVLVSINGTLQQPTLAYTVTGTSLTFVEVPASTDVIEVRYIALSVTPSVNATVVDTANVAVSTTTAILDSMSTNLYRSAKYNLQLTAGTDYQFVELHAIHNGTTANVSTVSNTATNGNLATFSANVSSGSLNLLITASGSTVTRLQKTYFLI